MVVKLTLRQANDSNSSKCLIVAIITWDWVNGIIENRDNMSLLLRQFFKNTKI